MIYKSGLFVCACSGYVVFLHSPFCPTAHRVYHDHGRAAQLVDLHGEVMILFLRYKGRLTYSPGFLKLIHTSLIACEGKKMKKGKKKEHKNLTCQCIRLAGSAALQKERVPSHCSMQCATFITPEFI